MWQSPQSASIFPGQGSYPPVPYGFQSRPRPSGLRIVYNNDPHEHWEGMSKSVSAFRALSGEGYRQGADVLRLNSGDNNTGSQAGEWNLTVLLTNLLNLHGSAVGNHEMDLTPKDLVNGLLRRANFPMLVSNLKIPPNSLLQKILGSGHLRTSAQIVQGQNGSYGLLGVTRPLATSRISQAIANEGIAPDDFQETCRKVQADVQRLQQQGINRIVLLSHMGLDYDRKLAASVSGIDVIVGGDSHDQLHGVQPGRNYLTSPSGEPVLILQAGANAEFVGAADLLFNERGQIISGQNVLHPTAFFPNDPVADSFLRQALPPRQPVAFFQFPYDRNRFNGQGDPLAQFTADAARQISHADISFVRTSELRKSIPAGMFSNWDLEKAMPYPDTLVRTTLSGREILGALQRSAQGLKGIKGEGSPLLHASGLTCTMNRTTGQVENAFVFNNAQNRWEPLDLNRSYRVAMGEYPIMNNREFPEFAHPERIDARWDLPMRGVLQWGLQRTGALNRPFQLPAPDSRLRITG